MARPNKQNLQYFPLDVNFFEDHKVLMIEEEFGVKGGYIAIRLMAMVYEQGYFLEWKDKQEISVAKRVGNNITSTLVMEVIKSCLKHKLFDKSIFESNCILTSKGIQKRWYEVMERLRRKVVIDSAIWLVSSEEIKINTEETTLPAAFSTQKEIKVNESKLKEESIGAIASPTDKSDFIPPSLPAKEETSKKKSRANFIAPNLKQVEEYMMKVKGDPGKPNSWPESKCLNLAGKCYDHYTANGWTQGKGKPIVDWEAACRNFIRNEVEGVFANAGSSVTKNEQSVPFKPKSVTNFTSTVTPAAKIPTAEEKAKMEKSFLNDAYTDFRNGKFNVQMMGIGVYESLKLFKQVKLSNADFTRILEKAKEARLSYLKSSTDRNDIELLKNYNPDTESEKEKVNMIAKRYVVSELFELFKSQGKTIIVE